MCSAGSLRPKRVSSSAPALAAACCDSPIMKSSSRMISAKLCAMLVMNSLILAASGTVALASSDFM